MNRLRAYRDLEDINQEELGDLLGLSTTMISAIEGGRRPFVGDLSKIGYANERFDLPDMSEPLHRQRASTKVAARKRAHELLRLGGEVFRELRAMTPRTPEARLERMAVPMLDDADDLATDTRYLLGHEPNGPIRNLTAAVERAGVCIVPMVGLEGIDGLSSWVDGVPVIGLAPSVPGDRFRLTLSHEAAHLMFHLRPGPDAEREANRFAAALLFPRDEFDAQMQDSRMNLRDFVFLKSSYGISAAALVYHAHDLGYINDQRYRALQIQMSKWRKNEPASFAPVHGTVLNRLVEANGGVDTVASKLGVNRKHLHALTSWTHLRVA